MRGGWVASPTERFKRDFKRLPVDIQRCVESCLRDLAKQPVPATRRLHIVSPSGKRPLIYTVDVLPNKSYKMSFELDGGFAVLRRVGTHQEIDRAC